ncbi:MAG: type I secretion system permease/ATPase [Tistlia sp.]|uniref:type I secretion system permease/ATPase n=1 Tax=Tistlia sp. TaxID=3057121 RepID=UPI0034A5AA12
MRPTDDQSSGPGFLGICGQAFGVTALFSVGVAFMAFASPLFSMQIYDRVLSSRSAATLLWLAVIVAFLLGAMALLDAIRSRILQRAAGRLEREFVPKLLAISFDRALTDSPAKGGLVLRDFDTLKSFLGSSQALAFFDAPMAPLFIAAIWLLHPMLGLIATGGALLLVVLACGNELSARRPMAQAQARSIAASTLLDNSLRNGEAMHAMGMVGPFSARLAGMRGHAVAAGMRAGDRAGTYLGLTKFVRQMLQVALLGCGAWLVIGQELSAGAIIAVSILSQRALQPVEQIIGAWKRFQQASRAHRNLSEAIATLAPDVPRVELPAPLGNLSAEGVVVCPPGRAEPVIRGVDLRVPAGTAVAIVGPSGSGKSSLLRALIGTWPLKSGVVRLDGADLHLWERGQLGPHVGYLPQDVELFPGTVGENIARFGAIDSEAVVAAARRANVHETVLAMPDGYDTLIGPGDHALSAGQRQMIGLARALYGDPKLLLLDEPNAHLDEAGERKLSSAIRDAKQRGAAIVVVSHRSGILDAIDALVMLEDGRVSGIRKRRDAVGEAAEPLAAPAAGEGRIAAAFPQRAPKEAPAADGAASEPRGQVMPLDVAARARHRLAEAAAQS